MRILYYMPFPGSVGADRWIYEGWRYAFLDTGHEFVELTERDPWMRTIRDVNPDLFFIPNLIDVPRRREALLRAREMGAKVFLVVHWPMPREHVEVIRREPIADIFFGEREPESMREFERASARAYHLIPNAANRRWHFPAEHARAHRYDIVYVGAYLPKKRRMFDEILRPLARRYRTGIFGPYWTVRDNILAGVQKAARRVRLHAAARLINRTRVRVAPEEERWLYSSARICPNFHEREEDGSQPHYIVNQRAFKIPACGGFQICDYVPALRRYFAEDEVVMARDSTDWFEKVRYYLENEMERRHMQRKAAERALGEHTYHHRVRLVEELYQRVIDGQ